MPAKRRSERLGESIDSPPNKKANVSKSQSSKKQPQEHNTPTYEARAKALSKLKANPLIALCNKTPGWAAFLESPPGQTKPPTNKAIVQKILASEYDADTLQPRSTSPTRKQITFTPMSASEGEDDDPDEADLLQQAEDERQAKLLKAINSARHLAANLYKSLLPSEDPDRKSLDSPITIPPGSPNFEGMYEQAWTDLSVLRARLGARFPDGSAVRAHPCRFCKKKFDNDDDDLHLCRECMSKLRAPLEDRRSNDNQGEANTRTPRAPTLDAVSRRLLPPGTDAKTLSPNEYMFYSKFNTKTLLSIADRHFVPLHEVDQMSFTQMTNQYTTTEAKNLTIDEGGTITFES